MCGKVTTKSSTPGSIIRFWTNRQDVVEGKWGFNNGQTYNARYERLDGIWRKHSKGLLLLDSFWEGNQQFYKKDGGLFRVGIIYNPKNEFAILTRPANEIVKPYHHRMPLIFTDESVNAWLTQGEINQLDESNYRLAS